MANAQAHQRVADRQRWKPQIGSTLGCCLFVFSALWSSGQHPSSPRALVWHFPYQLGLDFSKGSPDSVGYFEMTNMIVENAGCICDQNGQLAFYTNGFTVWDRQHQPMPNGKDLHGHPSSAQGALVIPKPGSDSLYYLSNISFSGDGLDIDSLRQYLGKWTYAEVDLSLRGGLGDVIRKNEVLFEDSIMEGQAACLHANGTDVWLLGGHWDHKRMVRILVTANGFSKPEIFDTPDLESRRGPYSHIRFSSDGSWVVWNGYNHQRRKQDLVIFRFDSHTGQLGDYRIVTTRQGTSWWPAFEFSPNSAYLYYRDVSEEYGQLDSEVPDSSFLMQLDLAALFENNVKKVYAEDTELAPFSGNLQLGIDGRLYMRAGDYIGVIHQPNKWGKAQDLDVRKYPIKFRPELKDLPSGFQFLGNFPNYISTYFYRCELDLPDTLVCNTTGGIWLDADVPYTNHWTWNGISGDSVRWVDQEGTYVVRASGPFCEVSDTVTVRFKDCPNDPGIPEGARLFIPNVFTPNGDGVNDRFEVVGVTQTPWSLRVYNRWGREVYASDVYQNDWDVIKRR